MTTYMHKYNKAGTILRESLTLLVFFEIFLESLLNESSLGEREDL